MRRDPMRLLLRVRETVLENEQRALAEALDAERRAIAAEHAARHAIRQEEEAAMSLDAGDGAVEAFAAWIPQGREAVRRAEIEHDRRSADLVSVRARLSLARAGVEAITAVLAGREAAALALAERREQAEFDELGRGRHSGHDDDARQS